MCSGSSSCGPYPHNLLAPRVSTSIRSITSFLLCFYTQEVLSFLYSAIVGHGRLMLTMFLMLLGAFILLLPFYLLGLVYSRRRSNKKYPISEEELRPYFGHTELQYEARVRKQWVLSYLLQIVLFFTLPLMLWWCEASDSGPFGLSATGPRPIDVLALAIREFLIFLIGYYCAYKRRGTIWLFWSIILMPRTILVLLCLGAALLYGFGWYFLMLTPLLGVQIWLWVNCIRLRRVNALRRSFASLARKNKYFQKEAVLAT